MRYEIKFVLDEIQLTSVLNWMHLHTNFKRKYSDRFVNSLYFDDIKYTSAVDNLIGIGIRHKIRLRWYHKSNQSLIKDLIFEIKCKNNRLGEKRQLKLQSLEKELIDLKIHEIYAMCEKHIKFENNNDFILNKYYTPTLQVKYQRSYYEDFQNLRMTIDKDILFRATLPQNKLFVSPQASYPKTILELKFDPNIKDYVSRLLSKLRITPQRHSKYLVGLSIFNDVKYI